jgi:phenylacetate-coenzyme A ligase PaaK-like adenylate-forming protein
MNLLSAMIKTKKAEKLPVDSRNRIVKERLLCIVAYAKKNSPYFSALYENLGDTFELSDIPPTNKVEMMDNFDDWLTDPEVSMAKVKDFTQNIDNVGRFLNRKYLVFMTSGSTGNSAIVLYDKTNIAVASAVSACRTFARKQDYQAFRKNGRRTAGVFAKYGFYLACGMSRYMSIKIPFLKNKITVDVNAPVGEIVKELNNFDPVLLSGYPSHLAVLCEQQDNGGLNIHPSVVITGGEQLTDDVRKRLTETFGCFVQTHYSCTEAGEIACECENGHLHVNDDWVIVEAVDQDNNPVADGTLSHKVLITNLSNFIQPFIRYEVTDRIIVHGEPCGCGKNSKWIEVEGRTDDILVFQNGVRIAPMSFYKILTEIDEIRRFQLVQKNRDLLELRIVSEDRLSGFELAKRKVGHFLAEKGIDVEIVLSEEVPQAHPVSGKFKHVFSEGE